MLITMNNLNPVQKKFIIYISILAVVMIALVIGYIFIQPSPSGDNIENDIDVSDSSLDTNDASLSTTLRISGATEFLGLLESLEIINELEQNSSRVTILAPSNDVMEESLLGSKSEQQLETIVRSHIIPTEVFTNVAINEASYSSLAGSEIFFQILNGELLLTSNSLDARSINPNIIFANGVIHIIDNLISN
jgi:hypothetical protein